MLDARPHAVTEHDLVLANKAAMSTMRASPHVCCPSHLSVAKPAAQGLATAVTLPLAVGLALLLGWNMHLVLGNKTTIEHHEGVTARIRVRLLCTQHLPLSKMRIVFCKGHLFFGCWLPIICQCVGICFRTYGCKRTCEPLQEAVTASPSAQLEAHGGGI